MILKDEQEKLIEELVKKENIELEELSKILGEIFNPNGIYSEVLIPLSFIFSEEGMKIFSSVFSSDIVEELTPKEVAEYLGVSRQYVGKILKSGKLKGRLKNGKWVISKAQLEIFAKGRKE